MIRVGIVAAEPSGDLLAAGLMTALKQQLPEVRFEGVAGPKMAAVGVDAWAPMDRLSVMGLFEVVRHLPRLLRLRSVLLSRWTEAPPALFVGVDAPDFNLALERKLRDAGVPTVHYVSPTVWAWRTGRVRTIRRAVDLLLTIFPFEQAFLRRYGVASCYVGHPLAAEMAMEPDRAGARARLGLDDRAPVLAMLPGSRCAEVGRLGRPFLETAAGLRQLMPDLQIVVPTVDDATRMAVQRQREALLPDLEIRLVTGAARDALAACDVVLTASGTATFEALLSKRPMVVGYKLSAATYAVARSLRLVKVDHVAMANLLADERLAPEFIQGECEARNLVPALLALFQDSARRQAIAERYRDLHLALRRDTNREAAAAVVTLLRERGLV